MKRILDLTTFLFILISIISLHAQWPITPREGSEFSDSDLEKVSHMGDLIIQGDGEYIIEGKEFIQL